MKVTLYCNPNSPNHQALVAALEKKGYEVQMQTDYKLLRLDWQGYSFLGEGEIQLRIFGGKHWLPKPTTQI